MPKLESFDITTGVDLQEVDNAVNQARKEIGTRFDFKNVLAEINYERQSAAPKLSVHTQDEFTLESIWTVLNQRLLARHVPMKNMKRGNVEKAGGNTVRQDIAITQAIDGDTGRKIMRFIKDQKYKKVQANLQGDEVRVSAPSRDELQDVIKDLRGEDWGMELKFGNYRS